MTALADTGPYGVGVLLSTLAGAKGDSGYLEGSGIAAKFNRPEGCAVSPDGQYVFVAGATCARRPLMLSSAHAEKNIPTLIMTGWVSVHAHRRYAQPCG